MKRTLLMVFMWMTVAVGCAGGDGVDSGDDPESIKLPEKFRPGSIQVKAFGGMLDEEREWGGRDGGSEVDCDSGLMADPEMTELAGGGFDIALIVGSRYARVFLVREFSGVGVYTQKIPGVLEVKTEDDDLLTEANPDKLVDPDGLLGFVLNYGKLNRTCSLEVEEYVAPPTIGSSGEARGSFSCSWGNPVTQVVEGRFDCGTFFTTGLL